MFLMFFLAYESLTTGLLGTENRFGLIINRGEKIIRKLWHFFGFSNRLWTAKVTDVNYC